jgi:hypothetical protein
MTVLGRRFDRVTLRAHAAVYLVAAAFAAGLVQGASRALLGRLPPEAPLATAHVFYVLVTAFAAYALRGGLATGASWWHRLPAVVSTAVAVWGLGGLLVTGLLGLLGPLVSLASAVATLRTGVLSLLAVGLAEGARRPSLRDLGLFVYPLLAIGGLKLVAEDLPSGNPAGLFVSFALYGTALIVAPRRLRKD